MPRAVIFFTVVIAAIVSKNIVNSASVQEIDVDKLLELVQQKHIGTDSSEDSSSTEDSDSSNEDIFTRSGKTDEDNLIDALQKLFNGKSIKQTNRHHEIRKQKPSTVKRLHNNDNKNSQRSEDISNILSLLLNSNVKTEPKPRPPKKHLTPNRLLWDGNNNNADLQDYSKVYVLLTPKAIQKTKFSRSSINELISKILSLSTSPTNRISQVPLKQKRYKGFVINQPARRSRGSREVYAPNDSVEDKPKRPRNNGGGGHTAIPYIRHRGENIYEKDN